MIHKRTKTLQATAKTAKYSTFAETSSLKPLCKKTTKEKGLDLEFARALPRGIGICADATVLQWNLCGCHPAEGATPERLLGRASVKERV